jgi:hypothetical protein
MMANGMLKTDYTPEACDQVVALMGAGHTLIGAAGAMEVSLETINRWVDEHEEFKDAVSRGRTARVFFLERQMLAGQSTAVINACRSALANAAPQEWGETPVIDSDEAAKSPLRRLAEQISGNAIRPRLSEPKIVEHEPVAPREVRPQQCVTIDDSVDKPRIHTVSREIYEDEG